MFKIPFYLNTNTENNVLKRAIFDDSSTKTVNETSTHTCSSDPTLPFGNRWERGSALPNSKIKRITKSGKRKKKRK